MTETVRARQKRETRQRLVKAASRVFSQTGLSAATTESVADAAGVAHGTVFAHFPTRDELLVRVIEDFGAAVAGRLHKLAGQGSGLREVLRAHLQGLQENEALYTRLVAEAALLPCEAGEALALIQSAISFHISQAAEREWERGTLRPMAPHLLFNTWVGLIHYYLVNRERFGAEGSVIARYGAEWLHHYMRLIQAEGGEK